MKKYIVTMDMLKKARENLFKPEEKNKNKLSVLNKIMSIVTNNSLKNNKYERTKYKAKRLIKLFYKN